MVIYLSFSSFLSVFIVHLSHHWSLPLRGSPHVSHTLASLLLLAPPSLPVPLHGRHLPLPVVDLGVSGISFTLTVFSPSPLHSLHVGLTSPIHVFIVFPVGIGYFLSSISSAFLAYGF